VTERSNVPTGRVKWFNPEKGFGFLSQEDGPDVFVHKDALPAGTAELKPGQRVEFGIVAGRRGDQALQVRILDPLPSVAASVAAATRKKPDELVPIIEDLIKLLDDVSNSLRRGRHPDRAESRKVGMVLRAVAADLES
jgi:CspA family cold shock protein